jgi:hypothetical protein
MHAIVAANAEFYSANLAAEAKKSLVQKAKMGGTPTRAPIGYLNVRKLIEGREVRTVEVDPERAPHIRWAFAADGSGAYTVDTLLAALTARSSHPADHEEARKAALAKPTRDSAPEPLLRRRRPLRRGRIRGTARAPDRQGELRQSQGRPRRPQPRRREGPQAPPLPEGLPLLRSLRLADEPYPGEGQRRPLLLHRADEGHRLQAAQRSGQLDRGGGRGRLR